MIVKDPISVSKHVVGCILTFNSKYLLAQRAEDDLWKNVTGDVMKGETAVESIIRTLREHVGLEITPSFFTTTYHQFDDETVAYHIFEYEFREDPFQHFKLDQSKLVEINLFSMDDLLDLNTFEDEEYCLYLHDEKNKYKNLDPLYLLSKVLVY
jgi:ADP-ribose pyrophosphatase YjhB (NUDIX family)